MSYYTVHLEALVHEDGVITVTDPASHFQLIRALKSEGFIAMGARFSSFVLLYENNLSNIYGHNVYILQRKNGDRVLRLMNTANL